MTDLSNLRGHQDWKWYGYPGHLMVNANCVYHLHTRVGARVVSTVGDYRPSGSEVRETIGSGPTDYFETMVFECDGEDGGDPLITTWNEIECNRYETSQEAEAGHYATCWRAHEGQAPTPAA